MALQLVTYLKGKAGNMVFYERNGVHLSRSLPASVHQSAAMKMRSRNFGIAATACKSLRQMLQPVIPFPREHAMQTKFTGAFAKWLRCEDLDKLAPTLTIPYVSAFEFNRETSLFTRWNKTALTVMQPAADLLQVRIPALIPVQAFETPRSTLMVECNFCAASCRLADGIGLGSAIASIHYVYRDSREEEQILSLPLIIEAGAVVLTAASLTYHLNNGKTSSDIQYRPAAVIDARYV